MEDEQRERSDFSRMLLYRETKCATQSPIAVVNRRMGLNTTLMHTNTQTQYRTDTSNVYGSEKKNKKKRTETKRWEKS